MKNLMILSIFRAGEQYAEAAFGCESTDIVTFAKRLRQQVSGFLEFAANNELLIGFEPPFSLWCKRGGIVRRCLPLDKDEQKRFFEAFTESK